MSAIFGAYALSAAALDPALAVGMDAALSHRPADATGHHSEARVLLGARALWVTPEAVGQRPPYCDPHTGVLCVADARLDHRDALAHELGLDERRSDEALLAAAYRRWGTAFAEHLLGDFACALYDPRERRLLLVRDPYGLRALYWARTTHALLFASQARALFAHADLSRELDALRVAQYLARDFGSAERTFFRHVSRLAPGHLLIAHPDSLRTQRYAAFDPDAELPPQSSAAYAERFRELFVDAVRVRMRSQLPVGCMLSGGLDSAGVLGAMQRVLQGGSVPCFSARFRTCSDADEGEWLRLHDATGQSLRHELDADSLGPLDDIHRLHAQLDEPFHAPNLFVYVRLAALAKQRGVRVLLDGLDGDTVVEHGYYFMAELLRRGRVRRLARELRAAHRRTCLSYGLLVRSFCLGPELDRARALPALLGLGARLGQHGYLARSFAHDSGFVAHARDQARLALRAPSSFRAMHHHALTSPIMPFYLEVHDKAAAALGLDHRHPFFDQRLIALCLALPAEQRLHDGWDRVIERRAFQGLVPDAIRARQSKSVWTANFQTQLLARNGPLIDEVIHDPESPLARYCDLARLRQDRARLTAHAPPERVLDLWCAVTLGLWLSRPSVTV